MIPFVDIAKLSCTNNASVVFEAKTCLKTVDKSNLKILGFVEFIFGLIYDCSSRVKIFSLSVFAK